MAKITPEIDQDKQAIKDNYLQAIADLDQIQNTDFTDGNTTQIVAKLDLAIRGQAAIIEKMLRFIKSKIY